MELRFAGRGDVREMRGATQYDKVTLGVQAKGGAAHFRDSKRRLDPTSVWATATGVAATVVAGIGVAATVAKDRATLEV